MCLISYNPHIYPHLLAKQLNEETKQFDLKYQVLVAYKKGYYIKKLKWLVGVRV
jgi:hypothetical protein